MELIHVKGNTWYLDGCEAIPLYKTSENTCILFDSGDVTERESIEETLKNNQLQLIGIIGTHAHTDHSANNSYFQKKYDIPVALPLGEAGISSSKLTLKSYFYMFTQEQLDTYEAFQGMVIIPDKIIMPYDHHVFFCDTKFQVLHTPGHSPDHISIITPDDVLYLGDALLTEEEIQNIKFPYFFSIQDALNTMEALCDFDSYLCLSAHKGICENIQEAVAANRLHLQAYAKGVADCITGSVTFHQLLDIVCEKFSLLSSNDFKCKLYERNVRIYLDYLVDVGTIRTFSKKGIVYYENTQTEGATQV